MTARDQSTYYVPHSSWYPIWVAVGTFLFVLGLGSWLNDLKAGAEPGLMVFYVGTAITVLTLYAWFAKVVNENLDGLNNAQVKRSYIWA